MIIAQVNSARDLAVTTSALSTGATAPLVPPPEQQDTFGPATQVALSPAAGAAPSFAAKPSSSSENVEKVISVDPDTRSVVYQSLNEETGAVVSQYPDEAKLRLRAYIDELSQQQTQAATAGTHPDPASIDGIRI